MSHPDDDSLMLAYVYGELSDDEARAFEARLAEDAGLRAEVDGLVATRDLLKQDARYGEVSGVDLPPPHLADAILRAEVLARPPEVRRAHAANGGGGFLARLQVWLVGGGLAVGAAAALLLVAKEGDMPAPEVANQAPPAGEAKESFGDGAAALDEKAAEKRALSPAKPRPVPAGEAQAEGFAFDDAAPVEEPPADEAESSVRKTAKLETLSVEGDLRRREREAEAPGRLAAKDATTAEANDDATRGDKADRSARAGPDLDALGAGDGEPFGADPSTAALEQKPMQTKEERSSSSRASRAAPKAVDQEEAPADAYRDDVAAASGGMGLVGGVATGTSSGAGMPGAGVPRAVTPSAEPAPNLQAPSAPAASAAPPGPPPLPEAARRQVEKKRAERQRAPLREKAKAKASAPSKQQALADELQMSLLTAEHELQGGRAQEALDLFTSVARRDPRGALTGVVPWVGQMRALQALKRHREVLALLPTVKRPGIKVHGVADGILVAARSAEALGDVLLARSLYRELLVVKDKRKIAAEALERLDALPAVRAKAAREYEADAEDAPAAAAPAEE